MTVALAVLLVMAVLALVGMPWWIRGSVPETAATALPWKGPQESVDGEIMDSLERRFCPWCGGRWEKEEGGLCPHCGRRASSSAPGGEL